MELETFAYAARIEHEDLLRAVDQQRDSGIIDQFGQARRHRRLSLRPLCALRSWVGDRQLGHFSRGRGKGQTHGSTLPDYRTVNDR